MDAKEFIIDLYAPDSSSSCPKMVIMPSPMNDEQLTVNQEKY
jgi:hypothetical protein